MPNAQSFRDWHVQPVSDAGYEPVAAIVPIFSGLIADAIALPRLSP